MATRRSDVIEATSAALEKLVKTGQKLLRHGVDSLAPNITRLEDVEDPGSLDDIAGDLYGSSRHMDGQLRKLGRSTVYKMCRYLYDIQIPLEKSYVAIRGWNEKEEENTMDGVPSTHTACIPRTSLPKPTVVSVTLSVTSSSF